MFPLYPNGRLLVYHGVVDLRKSYRSLCALVELELECKAKSGDGYIFVNRSKTLAKILWWDRTGWCLLLKRLSGSRYRVSQRNKLLELRLGAEIEILRHPITDINSRQNIISIRITMLRS